MPKIILKPRLARAEAAETRRSRTPAVPTPTLARGPDIHDVEQDIEDVQTKREESEGVLDDEEADVDEGEGEGEGEGDVDDGEGAGKDTGSFSRSRGRVQVRGGRGAAPAGTSRVRARGRAKVKGRAKGKGVAGDGEAEGEEGGDEEGRPWRRVGDRVYYIEGDEFVTESDEKGDQKIDIDGALQGGELGSVFVVRRAVSSLLEQVDVSNAARSCYLVDIQLVTICLPLTPRVRRDSGIRCTTSARMPLHSS